MSATAFRLPPPHGFPMEPSSTIEARIAERIHSFDLPALLDVLKACGYTQGEIEYRSHRSLLSHGHLVQAISFQRTPRRRVVVTVNLGLLSTHSPLPSFFFKAMDQISHDQLEDFLSYFDHHLLHARLSGYSPERDEALVGDTHVAEDRLQLLRPKCPSSLHWLCTRIFPGTLFLTVTLTLRGHFSHAALKNSSHLAYDPLAGGPERDHTVVLFSGNVSQSAHKGPRDTSAVPLVAT